MSAHTVKYAMMIGEDLHVVMQPGRFPSPAMLEKYLDRVLERSDDYYPIIHGPRLDDHWEVRDGTMVYLYLGGVWKAYRLTSKHQGYRWTAGFLKGAPLPAEMEENILADLQQA